MRSLLYEGYALYPYTPGVKNATPTPFGIVYPPAYADAQPAAFSMVRLEGVVAGGPEVELRGTVLFLQAGGEDHRRTERRLEVEPTPLAELARNPVAVRSNSTRGWPAPARPGCDAGGADHPPTWPACGLCVHNETEMADATRASRGDALRHSLISTHPLLEMMRRHLRLAR